MSDAENFVSRWSRLKREPETAAKAAPASEIATAAPPAAEDEGSPMVEAPPADNREPVFDPASLPPIESVGLNTDIRGFLQPRVPPQLMRAALRRAWASDPAIRDFIGIAESQWDFNDPTSIFGFGPMRATDNVPALLAQALGRLEDVAEQVMVATDGSAAANVDEGAIVPGGLPHGTEIAGEAGGEAADALGAPAEVAVAEETPRRARQHGGAMPK